MCVRGVCDEGRGGGRQRARGGKRESVYVLSFAAF